MARPGSPCSRARRSASVRHRLLSALLLRHAQRDGLRRCVLDATRLPSDALTLPLHPSLARAVRLKDPDRPTARGALQGHSRTRRVRQVRSDGHEPRRHLDGHAPQDAVQPVRPSPEWSSRAGASLLKLIDPLVIGLLRMHSNAQSHDVTINLIREVVERGYHVKEVRRLDRVCLVAVSLLQCQQSRVTSRVRRRLTARASRSATSTRSAPQPTTKPSSSPSSPPSRSPSPRRPTPCSPSSRQRPSSPK